MTEKRNITDYHYDAFISYRHLPKDMAVADKLQKLLEKHKIVIKGEHSTEKRKLRIFRDQTELPTSGDLGEDIRQALAQSRYLILICSPNLKESRWCMEEVNYFKQIWGNSNNRILPLLIDGEPDEVFPEQIRWENRRTIGKDGKETLLRVEVEPLGADIRGESLKKLLHRLKTEYYRIAAPILGCRFDDLYRRAQRARRRNVSIAVALILCAALSFSAYSLFMLEQISSRQSALYENESLRLASEAETAAGSGNHRLAILLAQESLPKNLENPERPILPEAEAALRSAVTQEIADEGKLPLLSRAVVPFNVVSWWICKPYDEGKKVALTDFDNTYLYDTYNGDLIFSCDTEQVYFDESAERASRQKCLTEDDKISLQLDLYWTDTGENYFSGQYEAQNREDASVNLFAIWEEDSRNCWVVKQTFPLGQRNGDAVESEIELLDRIDEKGQSHTEETLPEKIREIGENYQHSYLNTDDYITAHYDYIPDDTGSTGNEEIDILAEALMSNGYKVHGVREMKKGNVLAFSCGFADNSEITYNGYPETATAALWSKEEGRWLTVLPGVVYEEPESGLLYQHTSVEFRTYSWVEDNFGIESLADEQYLMVSEDGERYANVEMEEEVLYLTVWEADNLKEPIIRVSLKNHKAYYITPDFSHVFLQTPDDRLQLWSAEGNCLAELEPEVASEEICLTVDRDHRRLAVSYHIGEGENHIVIYSGETGETLDSLDIHDLGNYGISHLEFEGDLLLAASMSRSAVIDLTGEKDVSFFEDSNYGSRKDGMLTSDGLLICTSETNVGNSLEAIYDLNTGEKLFDYASVFQYDESTGTLAYINHESQATLSGSVYVAHRDENGAFREPIEIISQNANMAFGNGGQNLDGSYLLLNGENCCEIYDTDTGEKVLELNSGGYGLANGLICDLQKNGSKKALQFPVLSLDELYLKADQMLTSENGIRSLSSKEKELYYIVD